MVTVGHNDCLPNLLQDNASRFPDDIGYSRLEGTNWRDVSHGEFLNEVNALAKGLIARGIASGDRVALMSRTRYEWTLLDFAIWTAGAVVVPIYDSSAADQARWILRDAGVVAAIGETPRTLRVLSDASDGLPCAGALWCITDGDLESIARDGQSITDDQLEQRRRTMHADSLATIIYTSGTTGAPKGCELTHENFLANARNCIAALPDVVGVPGASTLLFLPLAHVFARLIEVLCVAARVRLAHTATTTDLAGKLASFRPTFLLAVPRVFEKLYTAAESKASASGRGAIFARASEVAIAYSQGLDAGRVPAGIRAQHAVFEPLVYRKIRESLGGQIAWAVSGGAPLGERLGHFFRGIGITVLEGYGLTETTAASTVNTPTQLRIGTVGPPVPGCTVRIAADGEVLLKGPQVFRSYRTEDGTETARDDAGWYATGDLGTLDDGFLRITGRKKEILVTAGGKNVAPAPLEIALTAHPLVAQAILIGDARPFIAALIFLDIEELAAWRARRGEPFADSPERAITAAADDPAIRLEIQGVVDRINAGISTAEAIRRFAIVPAVLSEESGHLTPKQSVKRHRVAADFADQIDALYR